MNREGALTGTGLTQFGRAMEELDIQSICANTPQAKGRVERRNRDLQDRLIKAMRLQQIDTLEEANAFLPSFIEDFNRRFAKAPRHEANAHRPVLMEHNLDKIFSLKTKRQLSKDLILQYDGVLYQIITARPAYTMRKVSVDVLETKDGSVKIEYKGQELTAVPYHQTQRITPVVSGKELLTALGKGVDRKRRPKKTHPWKRGRRGFSSKACAMA